MVLFRNFCHFCYYYVHFITDGFPGPPAVAPRTLVRNLRQPKVLVILTVGLVYGKNLGKIE